MVSWIVEKTLDACQFKKVKEVVVGGGVSANSKLRCLLPEEAAPLGIKVNFPSFTLTLDNAAMIAKRGFELYSSGKRSDWKVSVKPNLSIGEN